MTMLDFGLGRAVCFTLVLGMIATLNGCAVPSSRPVPVAGIENVANIIVGGGMIHCSSSLAVPSTQCSAPWTQILHDDPAFAGIAERDVLFGPVEPLVVTYQVTPAAMLAFESLPERLLWDGRMASSIAREGAAGAQRSTPNVLHAVYHPFLFRALMLPVARVATALR